MVDDKWHDSEVLLAQGVPLINAEIERRIKAERELQQAELSALRSQAKSREQLIIPLECRVLTSTTTTQHHSIIP